MAKIADYGNAKQTNKQTGDKDKCVNHTVYKSGRKEKLWNQPVEVFFRIAEI